MKVHTLRSKALVLHKNADFMRPSLRELRTNADIKRPLDRESAFYDEKNPPTLLRPDPRGRAKGPTGRREPWAGALTGKKGIKINYGDLPKERKRTIMNVTKVSKLIMGISQ